MPIVTAAEFSRMAGVSKVAVSKAPDATVHKEPGGKVDTDHPTNVIYLNTPRKKKGDAPASAKAKSARPAKPDPVETAERAAFQKEVTKRQAKKDTSADTQGMDLSDLSPDERKKLDAAKKELLESLADMANLPAVKMKEDIARIVSIRLLNEFKLATGKKNVISREEFRRVAEGWNTQLAQTVMRVPRRVVARLWAMAKAGDDARDGEGYLEKALSAAVTRALEGVTKAAK